MDIGAHVRMVGEEEHNNACSGEADLCGGQGDDVQYILQRDECRVRKRRKTQRVISTRRRAAQLTTSAACALLVSRVPIAMAQESCISLTGSTACPAFNASSISTNSNLTGLFPFLSDVTDLESFDTGIGNYVSGDYAQTK
jgi:hypothetical protein